MQRQATVWSGCRGNKRDIRDQDGVVHIRDPDGGHIRDRWWSHPMVVTSETGWWSQAKGGVGLSGLWHSPIPLPAQPLRAPSPPCQRCLVVSWFLSSQPWPLPQKWGDPPNHLTSVSFQKAVHLELRWMCPLVHNVCNKGGMR